MLHPQQYRYMDLHCDTITMLHYPRENLMTNKRMVSIPAMQRGGVLVQCFSAFVPTGFYTKPGRSKFAWRRFNKITDKKDALLQLHKDILIPIYALDDVDLCAACNKIGVLFTIEDAGVFGVQPTEIISLEYSVASKSIKYFIITFNSFLKSNINLSYYIFITSKSMLLYEFY